MKGATRVRRLASLVAILPLACGGEAAPGLTAPDVPAGTTLGPGSLQTLVFEAGGSSPEPVRVRATIDGVPLAGVRVSFSLPPELGRISQSRAPTDADGWAEAWILDARPGEGTVTAVLGGVTVGRDVRILRAPGSIEIDAPAVPALGIPGLVPPDSIVRARVLDTEGRPMAGRPVLFAWAGSVRVASDTTDAEGWAEGRLGASPLEAGEWPVFALLPGRPIVDLDVRVSAPVARRLVVVAWDGLRAADLSAESTPVLAGLAEAGAVAPRARSIDPTLSVPANLSMLAGEGPASHRLFSEDLDFTPEMNRLDPLFRVGLRRGLRTRAILGAAGHLARFDEVLECRLAFGFDPLVTVDGGDGSIVDAALPLLADDGPEMLFLHLADVDLAGHTTGWGSPDHRDAVSATDAHLARLAAALPEDALLAVVSAHGGGGDLGAFQHGSLAEADALVPLVLHGAGVAPGTRLEGVDLLDLAPTLGWALGWAPLRRWSGVPLLDAFGGTRPPESGRTKP